MTRPDVTLPRLTRADVALTREIEVLDEYGRRNRIHIPDERPLTLFVDRRELVTLMTLGVAPELLALGYLRNQRLVDSVGQVESVTVDWEVGAAAVRTHDGIVLMQVWVEWTEHAPAHRQDRRLG